MSCSELLNQLKQVGFARTQGPEINQLIQHYQQILVDKSQKYLRSAVCDLETIHQFMPAELINEFRLSMINFLSRETNLKHEILDVFRDECTAILGPDIAVQKNLNLVFTPPQDMASVIPLHADTWTGNSSFELTLYIPLTPTRLSHQMYIIPLEGLPLLKHALLETHYDLKATLSCLEPALQYLEMQPGEVMFFWHALPHGNKMNQSETTHWSLNFRLKNLFSPYGEKKLGDYFVPYQYGVLSQLSINDQVNFSCS